MSLIFSQLVYIDYFGVGGHGGCGINADLAQRNHEIIAMLSRHIDPSSYFLMDIDRRGVESNQNVSKTKKKAFFKSSSQGIVHNTSPNLYRTRSNFINSINNNNNTSDNVNNNNNTNNNNNEMTNRNYLNMTSSLNNNHLHIINDRHTLNEPNQRNNRAPRCIICNLL
jgi:hypothetical protein